METRNYGRVTILTATAALLFIGALIPTAHAANIWDGGGVDGFWNTANNWDNDTVPLALQNLTFSGNVQTTTTNNIVSFPVGTGVASTYAITFANNSTNATSGFTLAGTNIALGGDIVTAASSSSITDTIALNVQMTGNRSVTASNNHNVIISGAISQVSGTRTFTKAGTGEVILQNASNSYLGQTIINAGTLTVNVAGGIANGGTNSALGAGTTINSNSLIRFAGGTLNVTLGAGSTDRQVQIGSSTTTSSAGAAINNNSSNGSAPLVFSNAGFNVSAKTTNITTGRTLTLGGTNTDANAISGAIIDNDTAGGGLISVTKAGSGLWILSGSNTYSGLTTLGGAAGSSNGVLRIASVSSLPPKTTIVGSSGADTISTLELAPGTYSVQNYLRGNINFAASSGQATLQFTNTAVTNILTQGSGNKIIYASNVAVRFAGSLDISAVADSGLNKTATFSGNGDFSFDGPIIGPVVTNTNGSFTPGFVMNSTGVATLNASNTYAGATDVKQGTLQVNGSISTNTLSISNGATLAGLGTVGGDVFVSGNLQPGRGATNGVLTIRGNLTVATNGIVNLSIDSLAEYDRLAGASSYTVDGTINVAAGTTYSPVDGNTFQLFSGAIGGTPTLNVTPLSDPKYVWVTNNFTSTGVISVARVSATSDVTPPVISVLGATPLSVPWGGVFTDPGASFTDNVDASKTVYSLNTVDTSKVGSTILTYSAVDAGGNAAVNVTRTVIVAFANGGATVGADGLSDLMSYALGGTGPNSSPALPVLTSDANGLTLTANIRNDDGSGLSVIGQYAYSLEGPWFDVTPLIATGATSSVPNTTIRSFSRPFDENQSRMFMRFEATK